MSQQQGPGGFTQKLIKILETVGGLEAEPDADPEFIGQLRDMILTRVKPQIEMEQDPLAQAMAQMGGAPQGAPVEMAQAPTRLPRMRGNPLEQGAAMERQLSPEMGS